MNYLKTTSPHIDCKIYAIIGQCHRPWKFAGLTNKTNVTLHCSTDMTLVRDTCRYSCGNCDKDDGMILKRSNFIFISVLI